MYKLVGHSIYFQYEMNQVMLYQILPFQIQMSEYFFIALPSLNISTRPHLRTFQFELSLFYLACTDAARTEHFCKR